jgi:hypothetical protein
MSDKIVTQNTGAGKRNIGGISIFFDVTCFPPKPDAFDRLLRYYSEKGVERIFFQVGEFFPWSLVEMPVSPFRYDEKVIEGISLLAERFRFKIVPVVPSGKGLMFLTRRPSFFRLFDDRQGRTGKKTTIAPFLRQLSLRMGEDLLELFPNAEGLLFSFPEGERKESLDREVKALKTELPEIGRIFIGTIDAEGEMDQRIISFPDETAFMPVLESTKGDGPFFPMMEFRFFHSACDTLWKEIREIREILAGEIYLLQSGCPSLVLAERVEELAGRMNEVLEIARDWLKSAKGMISEEWLVWDVRSRVEPLREEVHLIQSRYNSLSVRLYK